MEDHKEKSTTFIEAEKVEEDKEQEAPLKHVPLTESCSSIINKKIPTKLNDPGSFTIPCVIGNLEFSKCLCDLGASINLMPLSIFRLLGLGEVKSTSMLLQLADQSIKKPFGVVENVLIKVDKFTFPNDFVVVDLEEDKHSSLILGRPFMKTSKTLIDVHNGKLILRVGDEKVEFNMAHSTQILKEEETCMKVEMIEKRVPEVRGDESVINRIKEMESEQNEGVNWKVDKGMWDVKNKNGKTLQDIELFDINPSSWILISPG